MMDNEFRRTNGGVTGPADDGLDQPKDIPMTLASTYSGRTTGRPLKLLASAACALTFALGMLAAPGASAADDPQIIAKAKEEAGQGKFLIMVSSPKGEKEQKALMEAFQKRFNLKLDWEWLPLTSGVSGPRVVEQAKSNVRLPSAIGGYPYTLYESWIVKNNLDEKVDWVKEFGGMFPDIKTAAVDTVLPRYHNRLLRQWDVHYVLVYNTKSVKKADLPTSIEQFTDPKWKGRFGMSNVNASPMEFLALDIGVDGVTDLTKKLVANQPRFKAGPPAVVGAVASGEIPVALCGYTALAESLKAKGAPIDWVVLDRLPLQPLLDFMLKGAPQPNLGKLFLAWLVTEGRSIQEKEEYLSAYSNPASPTTQAVKKMNPKHRVVEVRTDKDMETALAGEKAVMSVISGSAGK
jgi:iron(III) transport system substrate-binding protein